MRRTHYAWRVLQGAFLAMLLLALSGAGALAASESAGAENGGIVLMGQDWTLPAGETYNGDVVIISADATIEEGANLMGDLAVVSGNATIRGSVHGDIAVISGDLYLGPESFVAGDVSFVGGELQRATGSVVQGDIVYGNIRLPLQTVPLNLWPQMFESLRWAQTFAPPAPGTPEWFVTTIFRLISSIVGAFFTALVLAAIAAFMTVIWPDPLQRVATTAQKAPVPGFLVGLVVAITALVLAILLIITVCLSPFGFLLFLGLLAGWLMGWSALGLIVGKRLWDALNQSSTSDALPAAAGTFVISLISTVPCIGNLFGVIVSMVGLGAVVLSYFGTRVPDTV